MSQVVENRLKVFGAAVDKVGPMLVLLVPPNIWSKHKRFTLNKKKKEMLLDWPQLCSHNLPFSRNM